MQEITEIQAVGRIYWTGNSKLMQINFSKYIGKSAPYLAALSWSFLFFLGLLEQQHIDVVFINPSFSFFLKGLSLNVFLVTLYINSRAWAKKYELDYKILLWRVFISALVTTFFSGLLTVTVMLMDEQILLDDTLVHTFFFYIEFGLFSLFLLRAFSAWRIMILHEKKIWIHYLWGFFEISLFVALISHFVRIGVIDIFFNIPYIVLMIVVIPLSLNVKWITTFNFNQKLVAIFQLLVIFFCLAYFFASITSYFSHDPLVVDEISKSVFSSVLVSFVIIYALVSFLVTLFNLPTSSEFEKKFKEIAIFERLTDSLIEGKNKREVYQILLDNTIDVTKADAAWLEVKKDRVLLNKNISRGSIDKWSPKLNFDTSEIKRYNFMDYFSRPSAYKFNAVAVAPVTVGKDVIGHLVLLKRLHNSFSGLMVSAVNTYISQAGMALQNFKLLSKAVENERLKNEIQIAKNIHDRLLPRKHEFTNGIQVSAASEPASEVGGDFYDYYKRDDGSYAIMLADVAGHGLSAAFYLAQLKGVFRGIVHSNNLSPKAFLVQANLAISECLEKNIFVTASYYLINPKKREITYARAGHLPGIFYDSKEKVLRMHDGDGISLGILRNKKFEEHIDEIKFKYNPGDSILLYTDGITEAKKKGVKARYGLENLKEAFLRYSDRNATEITDEILKEVFAYAKNHNTWDDYTLLAIKLSEKME